ncbi:hypothetical protein HMPREF0591_1796 [Mycobacterium parascrofulaceum ATCC BAA-614]|uniref:Uncharacterized protein n=1 Tax=Mycobacterium parascrofulaceum ATCC BAA-614 TaxID=525368 RepID=D5P6K2_9MYCO|nr:hypothetical protein HMPREF0591_1796 [Mycobacterium parascrofulaceum ATCC BAA-614]
MFGADARTRDPRNIGPHSRMVVTRVGDVRREWYLGQMWCATAA